MPFDQNNPADVAKLRDELTADPRGYGYAADAAIGSVGGLQARLNAVRTGTNPPANPTAAGGVTSGRITVARPNIPAAEIVQVIDVRDVLANASTIKNATLAAAWFESVLQVSPISLFNPDRTPTLTRANLATLLGNDFGTQTRLDAVGVQAGSRFEELFGFGVRATQDDVDRALAQQG